MTGHRCPTGRHPVPSLTCRNRHGCKCDECVRLYRDYYRKLSRHRGGYRDAGLGDVTVVRAHIVRLMECGWTPWTIYHVTGVKDQCITRILRGESQRCWRRTRERIEQLFRREVLGESVR